MGYDIVVEGDGFLYKQVRIIAGTVVMVGMGLAPAETILTALAPDTAVAGGQPGVGGSASAGGRGTPKAELRMRGVVGPTLPPERLWLEHVEYEHAHESERGVLAPEAERDQKARQDTARAKASQTS